MKEWFKVKSFKSMPAALKDQAKALAWECFMSWRSEKERLEEKDKYYAAPFAHLIAMEKKRVIGRTDLFKREIVFDGKKITIGAVGGVCTAMDRRERGVASAMLEISMSEMKRQKCDIAFLTTDVNNPYMVQLYAKFGFAVLRRKYTFLGKSGKRYEERDGMLAPVRSKSIFNRIMRSRKVLDLMGSSF